MLILSAIGWRVGWITQLFWYALFGLYMSGSFLLFEDLKNIYLTSGVDEDVSGITALLTLVIFSCLFVFPTLKLHSHFYERRQTEEPHRKAMGLLLGGFLGVLVIFLSGQTLIKHNLLEPLSLEDQSIGIRLIKVILVE